jgi:hypothetical protein
MPKVYKTEDGKLWDSHSAAQSHANNIEIRSQQYNATWSGLERIAHESHNENVECYNAKDWKGIMKHCDPSLGDPSYNIRRLDFSFYSICFAKTGDLKNAIKWYCKSKEDITLNGWYGCDEAQAYNLLTEAENAVKELWEKENGRTMTRAEQIRIFGKPFPKEGSSSTKSGGGKIIRYIIIAVIVIIVLYNAVPFVIGLLRNKSAISVTQTQTVESQTQAPLNAFNPAFIGTWLRDNYSNTLTFQEKTLKSSSQSYTWNFNSTSGDIYTIKTPSGDTARLTIKLVNGNIVISGDSGSSENNWNGTWKKQ